jgi:hypothetical protein
MTSPDTQYAALFMQALCQQTLIFYYTIFTGVCTVPTFNILKSGLLTLAKTPQRPDILYTICNINKKYYNKE